MKRGREDGEEDLEAKRVKPEEDAPEEAGIAALKQEAGEPKEEQNGADMADGNGDDEEDDEDTLALQLPRSTTRSAVKKGQECPYLDTILRQVKPTMQAAFIVNGTCHLYKLGRCPCHWQASWSCSSQPYT